MRLSNVDVIADESDFDSGSFFKYFLIFGIPGLVITFLCLIIFWNIRANCLLLPNYFASSNFRSVLCTTGSYGKLMSLIWSIVYCFLFFAGIVLIILWAVMVCYLLVLTICPSFISVFQTGCNQFRTIPHRPICNVLHTHRCCFRVYDDTLVLHSMENDLDYSFAICRIGSTVTLSLHCSDHDCRPLLSCCAFVDFSGLVRNYPIVSCIPDIETTVANAYIIFVWENTS